MSSPSILSSNDSNETKCDVGPMADPDKIEHVLIVDDTAYGRSMLELHAGRVWPEATFEKCDVTSDLLDNGPSTLRFDLAFVSQEIGPDTDSYVDWLRMLNQMKPCPITIVIASQSSERSAIKAIKRGADDYLDKELVSANRLRAIVEESVAMRKELLQGNSDTLYKTWRMDSNTANLLRDRLTRIGVHSSKTTEQLGRRVPGYEGFTLIGKGAMAEAWRARRTGDGLDVVLKILPFKDEAAADLLKQFMREYEFVGELHHPNIASIHERAFAADFAYIAMEYLPGGDLTGRVRGGVEPEEAIDFVVQIAKGLQAAHAQRIVHRDLKPANILFRDEQNLAIIDFGIAKAVGPDAEITDKRSLKGTPYYMSPEIIQGREIDTRADLYSLGVLLFEMLAGRRPYNARPLANLLKAHLLQPIPGLPPHVAALQPLVDGLLAKEPDDRFQGVDELLLALDSYGSRV